MNAALRKALAAAQLTETDVAAHLGVDPKTVRRWLSGQRPYPRHRWALSNLLQIEEDTLWPQGFEANGSDAPASEQVQRVYAHRWQVPRKVWWDLFRSADKEIGILVYSGLFLADDAGIIKLLTSMAENGVHLRILLGDPESAALERRGKDEGIGGILASRARNSMLLLRSLEGVEYVDIRAHFSTLYNSIFMTEEQMLINHHTYGVPASESCVVSIDRKYSPSMYEIYARSFQATWEGAT